MLHMLGFQAASRALRPALWLLAGVVVVLAALAGGSVQEPAATAASRGGHAPLASASVTQGFGRTDVSIEPYDAACPTRHFHSGIDLAAAAGTPILAVTAGTVTVFASATGYGRHVMVAGGGLVVLYGHLAATAVSTGNRVAAGDLLGWVGSSGNSTGAHLHFEVRRGGAAIDPSPWLPDYGSLLNQGVKSWSTRSS